MNLKVIAVVIGIYLTVTVTDIDGLNRIVELYDGPAVDEPSPLITPIIIKDLSPVIGPYGETDNLVNLVPEEYPIAHQDTLIPVNLDEIEPLIGVYDGTGKPDSILNFVQPGQDQTGESPTIDLGGRHKFYYCRYLF